MGTIIRMNSKEFLKDFLGKFNPMAYNIVLVSEDIKTKQKYKSVTSLPKLIPATSVISKLVSDCDDKEYYKRYYSQLSQKECDMLITIIVKLALVDDVDVILMCSETESEYGYLEGICNYIEEFYLVDTYSYKKYKKNPKKCRIKKSRKTEKAVMRRFEAYRKMQTGKSRVSKSDIKGKLEKLDKSDLKQLAKRQGIKASGMSRSDMIKKILKSL